MTSIGNPNANNVPGLQAYDDTNHNVVNIRAKNITTDSTVTPNVVVGDLGVDVEVTVASITNDGTFASHTDVANIATIGAKTDAKDSHTDATAISLMQVLKQISFYLSQAVPVGVTAGTSLDGNSGTISANSLRTVAGGTATGTKSNVASSGSSVTILAANTSRKGAMIYNDSTQILYLDLSGGTASSSSYSVQIPAQGFFELPGPNLYNGLITGIWASANGNARVTEFS